MAGGVVDSGTGRVSPLRNDSVSKTFECPTCHRNFTLKQSLKRHLKIHTDERPFKCSVCQSLFRESYRLYKHVKAVHPTVLLKSECDECSQAFLSKALLKLHKERHHKGNHECEICGRVFTLKKYLTQHKKIKHPECFDKPFICNLCSRSFTLKYLLSAHLKLHEEEVDAPNSQMPFVCDVCGKGYHEKYSLARHYSIHYEKLYGCKFCQKACSTLKGLQLHEERHVSAQVRYKCEICQKSYPWKSSLNLHKRTIHSIIEPYECTICKEEFDYASALREHRKSHVGEKCYKCTVCFKLFYQKTRLVIHKRRHTGEKPFLCEVCGKCFRSTRGLRFHADRSSCTNEVGGMHFAPQVKFDEILQNKRQRECPICHVSFKTLHYLKLHVSAHPSGKQFVTGRAKKYQCSSCNGSSLTASSLGSHSCYTVNGTVKNKPCIVTIRSSTASSTHNFASETQEHEPQRNARENSEASAHEYKSHDTSPSSTNSIQEKEHEHACLPDSDLVLNEKTASGYRSTLKCVRSRKEFADKQSLKARLLIHTKEKMFKCEMCSKRFSSLSSLCHHKNVHSGEKPFSCHICDRRFRNKSYLTSHRIIHTGEKPFKCGMCDKSFAQKSGMYNHRKVHIREQKINT